MERIEEIKENERTGKDRFITIDNLDNAANNLVCKECVTEEIEGQRRQRTEIIASHLITLEPASCNMMLKQMQLNKDI